jgi:DNA repair protein RadD
LIFASGIAHGTHICRVLEQLGAKCGFVTGETPPLARDTLLSQFRKGELKYLVNVNVLTTGFDAPHIDCVALLRPTMSPGLYYQMVGRGFRLAPGKTDCLVLDFGGNVLRHGPVDQLRLTDASDGQGTGEAPAKECPQCNALIAAGFALCPECGHEFPQKKTQTHTATASTEGVLSGHITLTEHHVSSVHYSVHTKRDADESAPKTMRVDYEIGLYHVKSEWVCFEHDGYARMKALAWWRRRTDAPFPKSSQQAVEFGELGLLAQPSDITVKSVAGDPYDRIVDYKLGDKPPVPQPAVMAQPDPEEGYQGEPDELPAIPSDDIPF